MSRLRIVAGDLGGRFIDVPPGPSRPTREKVREAWFNALGGRLEGLCVADLFAGSGALGLEALSRGAARVHFVESDGRASRVLTDNVEALGVSDRAEIVRRDVADFLDDREERGVEAFDLGLADPPYDSDWPARLADRMARSPFAKLLCVEHRPGALEGARSVVWRRRYGDTELTCLRPGPVDPAGERPEEDGSTRRGAPER